MWRFGLEELPSEDTVRREVTLRIAKELLWELVVNQDDLWFYENDSFQSPQQRYQAEIRVEKAWAIRRGRSDFKKHPMFGYFQRHLPGHPCWSVLEKMANSYRQYVEAVQQAFAEVRDQVKTKLVHVSISARTSSTLPSP
jgi:hypothetical protein